MKLDLKNVGKSFKGVKVLKGIDLCLEGNQVIGILGPNGAGKTTLMRIITGFYAPNTGKILIDGEEADPKDSNFKKYLGYLPENNPLYGQMTAGEYLDYIGRLKGLKAKELSEEISKKAKDCDLNKVLGQKIETLSKGYRQRVGLAASLIGNPEILILDEPTSGLDPNQIIEARALIKKLAKNMLVIISTHILPEAKAICDQLLIINRGEIVLNEKTDKIKNLEKKFIELTA